MTRMKVPEQTVLLLHIGRLQYWINLVQLVMTVLFPTLRKREFSLLNSVDYCSYHGDSFHVSLDEPETTRFVLIYMEHSYLVAVVGVRDHDTKDVGSSMSTSLKLSPQHLPGIRLTVYILFFPPPSSFSSPSECKGLRASVRIRPRPCFC